MEGLKFEKRSEGATVELSGFDLGLKWRRL